jgi:organic hydroperoxide reductase OsmC/OhrA
MLFFVDYARRAGFVVESYVDEAEGVLDKRPDGKMAMTLVTLRPKITFSGANPPSPEEIADLHHRAHEDCFIANSVTTEVTIEQ